MNATSLGEGLCAVDDMYLWKAAKKRALSVGVSADIFDMLCLKVH